MLHCQLQWFKKLSEKTKDPRCFMNVKILHCCFKYFLQSWLERWTRNLFLKGKSCFSGQQFPCPFSNWEYKITQVVFSPMKHNFSDSGPKNNWLTKSTVRKNVVRKIILSVEKKKTLINISSLLRMQISVAA